MGNALKMTARELTGIASRLLRLRKLLILTQEELAEMMGVTGMTICNLETRKYRNVSQGTLKKLRKLELKVAGDKGAALLRTVPK